MVLIQIDAIWAIGLLCGSVKWDLAIWDPAKWEDTAVTVHRPRNKHIQST